MGIKMGNVKAFQDNLEVFSVAHETVTPWGLRTHHQVPQHHHCQEQDEAYGFLADFHAIPHVLNPLPTEDPEDDEEGVEEVMHVPARPFFFRCRDILPILAVVVPEELLADQSKDKDDDGQDDGEVPQSPHRVSDDLDERV